MNLSSSKSSSIQSQNTKIEIDNEFADDNNIFCKESIIITNRDNFNDFDLN